MPLKSIDSPRPSPSSGRESAATVSSSPKREVVTGETGPADSQPSRASEQFLVKGTSERPLKRPRSSPLESILGDTDRRKQILETELTPWRMICALEIESASGAAFVGTGWFAGPRTVITAGHCVFDPVELGGWAKKITVVPGRNVDKKPFKSASSSVFSTTDRWQEAQEPDFDYGVIHLSSDLGAAVGSFSIGVLPDAALQNRLVNVSGYPFEPGEGKAQYFHANRVKALTGRRLFYDIDTMGGQSGSPVWAYEEGSEVPVVVAIHAYGVGGVPANLNVVANSGPRVLPEVLEVIRGWIARGNSESAAAAGTASAGAAGAGAAGAGASGGSV
jgi:V8-like Glu-specific endopeptidase